MKFTTIAVFAASALTASAWYNETTSTYCPPTTTIIPTGFTTVSGYPSGFPTGPSNSTLPSGTGSNPSKTPIGPSSTTNPGGPAFTGGAASNTAFTGLAAIGLVVAYFL